MSLTALSRTIFSKHFLSRESEFPKIGIESLPGQVGTVTSNSRGGLNEAAVKVYGSEWTAFPVDGESELLKGEKVEVVSVTGATIYVRKVKRELPGWKQD
jgi:membrane protein implicated in regulation of membrane protease activity